MSYKSCVKAISINKVDRDVQSMLLPLNFMQYVIFCPKYGIKHNALTPNSFVSNFVSLIATVVLCLSVVYTTYLVFDNEDYKETSPFLEGISFYDYVHYSFGLILNFVSGVIQTKTHITFVLTFQRVHRLLNNEISFKNFTTCNWIIVIMALSLHFIIFSGICFVSGIPYLSLYVCYISIAFDANIIYAVRVLELLDNKVALWTLYVSNIKNIEEMQRKNYTKEMFHAYEDLLKCYDIYKDCFQQLILYYIIELFIHALIYCQVSIEAFKLGIVVREVDMSFWGTLSVVIFMMKYLIYLTILSKQCEKFYLSIQCLQDTCTLILLSNCLENQKVLCKNVLRLHRASFSKIRVCGLFYIDAAFQLSLMSLLTSYIIVLLQFAIL